MKTLRTVFSPFVLTGVTLGACGTECNNEVTPGRHSAQEVNACIELFYAEAEAEFPDIRAQLDTYGFYIEFADDMRDCPHSACAWPDGRIRVNNKYSLCSSACGALGHELYHIAAWAYGLSSEHEAHQGTWWGMPYEQTAQYRIQEAFRASSCNGDMQRDK